MEARASIIVPHSSGQITAIAYNTLRKEVVTGDEGAAQRHSKSTV